MIKSAFIIVALAISLFVYPTGATAQWVRTNGPYGGYIRCLAVCGPNIYAGSEGGGIFRSTDNGASWTIAASDWRTNWTYTFAVREGTVFAGTQHGVCRSTDGGATWPAATAGLGMDDIRCLAVAGKDLIAGGTIIGRSTDGGQRWTRGDQGAHVSFVSCFAVTGRSLFVGDDFGKLFRSSNGGVTWKRVDTWGFVNHVNALASTGRHVYAGTSMGVYRSTDNGTTWAEASAGLANRDIRSIIVVESALIVGTFSGGIYRSTDKGRSWAPSNTGLTNMSVFSLAATRNLLIAGTRGGGVFLSTNNGSVWYPSNYGLSACGVSSISAIGGKLIVTTGSSGIFVSANRGENWAAANSGLDMDILSIATSGPSILVGTGRGVYRSVDTSAHWEAVSLDPTYKQVRSFAVVRTEVFAGTNGAGVYRSTDGGSTWQPAGLTGSSVEFVAAIRKYIVAVISRFPSDTLEIFRTSDYGQTWLAGSTTLVGRIITSFFVNDTDFFAMDRGRLVRSTDCGETWSIADSGLPRNGGTPSLSAIGTILLAGTGEGEYRSNNRGTSCDFAADAQLETPAHCFAISEGYIYAGTGRAIWRRRLSEISDQ